MRRGRRRRRRILPVLGANDPNPNPLCRVRSFPLEILRCRGRVVLEYQATLAHDIGEFREGSCVPGREGWDWDRFFPGPEEFVFAFSFPFSFFASYSRCPHFHLGIWPCAIDLRHCKATSDALNTAVSASYRRLPEHCPCPLQCGGFLPIVLDHVRRPR